MQKCAKICESLHNFFAFIKQTLHFVIYWVVQYPEGSFWCILIVSGVKKVKRAYFMLLELCILLIFSYFILS